MFIYSNTKKSPLKGAILPNIQKAKPKHRTWVSNRTRNLQLVQPNYFQDSSDGNKGFRRRTPNGNRDFLVLLNLFISLRQNQGNK